MSKLTDLLKSKAQLEAELENERNIEKAEAEAIRVKKQIEINEAEDKLQDERRYEHISEWVKPMLPVIGSRMSNPEFVLILIMLVWFAQVKRLDYRDFMFYLKSICRVITK